MFTIENLTTLFGWCTVINVALLSLTTLFLAIGKDWISSIHHQLFGIDKSRLMTAYFRYLANYKLAILIFNLTPFLALKMIT